MNTIMRSGASSAKSKIAAAVAAVLLAACANAPMKPDGAAEVRAKLTRLQADPSLSSRAPLAIQDADTAVRTAEQPQTDAELGAYRVYIADRKVETALAQAQTSRAEDQRAALEAQRESARLAARTREADVARGEAATARAEGEQQKVVADQARNDADAAQGEVATARAAGEQQKLAADQARNEADAAQGEAATARAAGEQQKLAADQARNEADAARVAASSSQQQATEMQRQIDLLQARPTDQGLVLTLGDVTFTSGRADLMAGGTGNLNRLVAFLNKYPDRTVSIHGYTDNVGSEGYNQGLSERRAESVKSYLAGQGIGSIRLSAAGKGEGDPVASNDSAAGRQQNRRVEIVISNPTAAVR
ncbi:MAG TPA: OmpA family protein [Steroidobacteraceae bacterium]